MNFSIAKSLSAFCVWLDQTPLSQTIQVTNWAVPTVQSVHILAIAVVTSSALMIDLRLIRVYAADQPMKDVLSRYLPFVWWSLLVLLVTGAIMIIGEPARSLKNPAFQLKMVLLVAVLVLTCLLGFLLRRQPTLGEPASGRYGTLATIAVVSMLLWSGIIFAGRWIAYYS